MLILEFSSNWWYARIRLWADVWRRFC